MGLRRTSFNYLDFYYSKRIIGLSLHLKSYASSHTAVSNFIEYLAERVRLESNTDAHLQ